MVLRAKTIDLLQLRELTEKQKLNTELNIKELKEEKIILCSYPRRVVLELTNICNFNCIMCGRDEVNFAQTIFDFNNIEKLSEIFEHVEEVTLFGWGEPTLHPQFIDILKFLNNYPVRKYFVTNGSRLKKIKNAIFDFNLDILAVSLDGARAETNNRIRRGSNFDQIIFDLADIVDKRKRQNTHYPYINFVFTAMKSNFHELPELVKLAHKIGVEEVKVVYLTVFSENLLNESLFNHYKEVKSVFEKTSGIAESLNIKLKLPYIQNESPAGNKFHLDCFVGWRDFFLGSDGYVRPCQSTAMKLFPFSKYSSFMEMWNSPEYQNFRKNVNNQITTFKECKRCYQSSHANSNLKSAFIQIGEMFAPEWNR